MRRTLAMLLMLSLTAVAAVAQESPAKPAQSDEEALKSLRAEMQASKADVMAKNLTLTADQAAKFWPMFQAYQKEQNAILDEQLVAIKNFVDSYETLTDAQALALMNGHFDRDARVNALRKKWLGEFQKVLPGKVAVRAMQIDRRLSMAIQSEMAAHIPLAR
jgi:Spy/CpxP family protein refolding chaperone